jgi:hypothetical protein
MDTVECGSDRVEETEDEMAPIDDVDERIG